MKKLIILIVLGAFVAGIVMAVRLLGYWPIPVGVLLLLCLPFLLKLVFLKAAERIATGLFDLKSAALRHASAVVHAVRREEGREDASTYGDMDDVDETPREFWMVDLSIRPSPDVNTPMALWEPGELRLIKPGSDTKEDDDSLGLPAEIQVLQEDGSWSVDEGMKYPGEQRLRVLFAAKQGVRRAEIAYYFERLATVELGTEA